MILTKLAPTNWAGPEWHDPTLDQPTALETSDNLGAMHGVEIALGQRKDEGIRIRVTQYRAKPDGAWSLKIERDHGASIETIATIEP